MKIEIKILNKEFYQAKNWQPGDDTYDLPTYATQGSAGIDLVATQGCTIFPGETVAIPTGLAIHIGSGIQEDLKDIYHVMGMIAPRSGLGTKGLILANTIGIIDEDYQGELIIQSWNRRTRDYKHILQRWETNDENTHKIIEIKAGDRFAQLIFVPVVKAEWQVVDEFSSITDRNTGGFGSTGN